jgi:hypothetical protein
MIEGITRQFQNAFGTLGEAMQSLTSEQWSAGSPPYDGPGRAAIHALQAGEFYTCEDPEVWGNFGRKVWEMTDAEIPPVEAVEAYRREVMEKTRQWVAELGKTGLDRPVHPDYPTALERVLYALRHLQHHVGEICAYQKALALPPAEWR